MVGIPPPWAERDGPSDGRSTCTPQDPAEDAPINWNFRKLSGILKKIVFTNGFQRPAQVPRRRGQGQVAELWNVALSAPWNGRD